MKKLLPIASLRLCLFTATSLKAQNPIIQTKFTADPAPMVYHDTVHNIAHITLLIMIHINSACPVA